MRLLPWLLLLCASGTGAQPLALHSGHLKGQYQLGSFPDDSLLRQVIGSPSHDVNGDLRLLLGGSAGQWRWQGDYQFIARSGDSLALGRELSGTLPVPGAVPDDERRLLDLTHIFSEGDDRVLAHRLDRLHLGYSGDKTVLRLGRQAVSWGNGLLYNPVDFFNPFDPAAVDKEYKPGDDMLYAQYLQDNGNDWQAVSVWRRNAAGDTDSKVNTHALKYHAFIGERELDLLLASHYEDDIATVGGISNWGGAIVRGDVLLTDTASDTYVSAVANLTYSWIAAGRNMSGVLEYFFNGMGLREADYSDIADQADLLARLGRGELFTIGRHYLAGGVTIEMSPLVNLSPNLFVNLGDGSGLGQLVGQYDFKQDWQLLMALNLPFGDDGTEFGGLESGIDDLNLASGPSLFAQLAFWF